jgi:NhaA family Na+:H+ antiporter
MGSFFALYGDREQPAADRRSARQGMIRRVRSATRDFLHSEAAGGIVLMAAAACAMLVANLPGLSADYFVTGPVLTDKLGR